MKLWELEDKAKSIRESIYYDNKHNELTIRKLIEEYGINGIRYNYDYLGCEIDEFIDCFGKDKLDIIVKGSLETDDDGYTYFNIESDMYGNEIDFDIELQ